MEKVSYWRAMGEIEKLVKESIPGSHPKSWEVHALTQRLLLGLQSNLQDAPITGFRSDFTVRCAALRHRPVEEESATNGATIAVVTRIVNRDGTLLEGASFLEARIKSDRKRTFEAFTLPPLRKSLRGSPFTQLLLFDYEDITAYSSNRSVAFPAMEYSPWRGGLPVTPCTYAVVSPLNVVLAQHLNDTGPVSVLPAALLSARLPVLARIRPGSFRAGASGGAGFCLPSRALRLSARHDRGRGGRRVARRAGAGSNGLEAAGVDRRPGVPASCSYWTVTS